MKKILFRADAKPSIGVGDLMSLITLSKYLDETWKIYFIIKDYTAALKLVNQHQLKNILIIKKNITLENEITFINNNVKQLSIDIICLEITEIKLSFYNKLVREVKKVAINFDGYIPQGLDLLINWDIDAKTLYKIKEHSKTKFLLGPQYVILPKELYRIKKKNNIDKPKKLLIAMGGADEFNLTQKIISVILKNKLDLTTTIVIGAGYEYLSSLQETLKRSTMKCNIKQNITNMTEEYINCDIAIGAGGLTASELIASKVSTILIATYQHQVARCQYFHNNGFACYLGLKKFNHSTLVKLLLNPSKIKGQITFKTPEIIEEIKTLVNTK